MASRRYRFFHPAHAVRLKGLELTVRGVVEGVYAGLHKSPHRGFSIEFAEHREYVPGDEIKHLDWTVLARSDRYYIKQYEQETNLRAMVCLDISGSMGWSGADDALKTKVEVRKTKDERQKTKAGGEGDAAAAPNGGLQLGRVSKFEYGAVLAASLANVLSNQQDVVGLTLFDDAVRQQIAASSGAAHLDQFFRLLEEVKPGRETDVGKALHQLANRIPRRGLVILISDFLDEPDHIIRALQQLKHARHQLIVIQVLDRAEVELPFGKPMMFEDMEDGTRLQIDPKAIRAEYVREMRAFLDTLKHRCGQFGMDYVLAITDVPWETQVRDVLRSLLR